ncbi:MAG: hypothetical protein SVM79_07490 [Chloroflexota bacterium]|nr:hypothetical protein [Chloroflexota bacterium]
MNYSIDMALSADHGATGDGVGQERGEHATAVCDCLGRSAAVAPRSSIIEIGDGSQVK